MKVGIIGSGVVGQELGLGLLNSGNEVMIGSRNKEKLTEWIDSTGQKGKTGNSAETAKFGEIIIIATKWLGTKNAIDLAGPENFKGKVVIDVTNPLQNTGEDQIPSLNIAFPNSAGSLIQSWLPDSQVVKAFNIISAYKMCRPALEEGTADLFIAGNNEKAKATVRTIAENWGWKVHDIGEINESYLLESLAMLWIRIAFLNDHWTHAFKLLMK